MTYKEFYKLKMQLYGDVEQKLLEVKHTLKSIQHHEIDAPDCDLFELKELNQNWAKLEEVRQFACSMMDALHPMVENEP